MLTKQQQKGILLLLFLIVSLQIIRIYLKSLPSSSFVISEKESAWLNMQTKLDSLKIAKANNKFTIYPFNPNFISDYKGYQLGMTNQEIDRLLAFRKQNKYVNSAAEFQQVTQVNDELLAKIAPHFKFPDWVKNKQSNFSDTQKYTQKKNVPTVLDINLATAEDFKAVYGIGEVFSGRILNFRNRLGGFVSMKQLNDIWGLPPEVVERLEQKFKLNTTSSIKKIDINNASIQELKDFPYFNYKIAKEIVTYRSMNGDFKDEFDLTKIKGLSTQNTSIIALYLLF